MSVTAQVSKKAARDYNKAIRLKAEKKPEQAYKAMKRAIAKDPIFPDAYSLLGQWYFTTHKFYDAELVFKMASTRCAGGGVRFAKPLAKSLIYAGHPEEALNVIGNYATVRDSAEWNKIRRQAYTVRQAMASPTGPPPVNLGVLINTEDPELFPSMSADTQTLYFTRRVNNMDEDLFSSQADSCGGWFTGRNLGDPPNTPDQESAQFISADGHYLFFTRCDNRSYDEWTEGGCDLFMAYRIANDSPWTTAQPFGATINTPAFEGMPSLSPDNRELFFVSDRPGGFGGYDIWISRFDNGLWQLPVNAGPSINTPGNETAPYIAIDNKTLFFTSDGWPGLGGNDLFSSRRINENSWQKAENMGYPINSPCDEKSVFVTSDGGKMYFASDRNGPPGNYDIYETILGVALQPAATGYLQGFIYDSLTWKRLSSSVLFICNATSGDTLYQVHSNRGDASYLITLPVDVSYAIHSWHMEYKAVSDTIFLDKKHVKQPLEHNIALLPSDYTAVKPIHDSMLAILHFDKNKVALSDSDKSMLRDAIAPWISEKGFMMYVNAYTDNTGTPMLNEELSAKRAMLVTSEITALGIYETMVVSKGWGEAKMIATNETEEGQRMNRRVEVIITRY